MSSRMYTVFFIIAALSAVHAVPAFWEEFIPMTITEQQHDQLKDEKTSPWSASNYLKNSLPDSIDLLMTNDDKRQQHPDQHQNYQQQDQQSSQQSFPWSASKYLKNALPKSAGLVTTEDLVAVNAEDVVKTLKKLGLSRAADITEKVGYQSKYILKNLRFFTMIVPTDAALDSFDKTLGEMNVRNTKHMDSEDLFTLWSSWVVPRISVRKADMINDLILFSYGPQLRLNQYQEKITVNGFEMSKFDLPCDGGVVHVTNRVMYPLPDFDSNILETLEFVPQFSKFVSLVQQAGMTKEIGADAISVFVPTNAAFDAMDDQLRNDLSKDQTKAKQLIRQHIVKGTWYSAGLSDGKQLQTANQNQIGVRIENNRIFVNELSSDIQPEIIYRDMSAYNGVFHVINRVILRPTPTHLTWN